MNLQINFNGNNTLYFTNTKETHIQFIKKSQKIGNVNYDGLFSTTVWQIRQDLIISDSLQNLLILLVILIQKMNIISNASFWYLCSKGDDGKWNKRFWSDGCRKHFKTSIMMIFMLLLSDSINLQIEWNFFYHITVLIPAAAAQLNRKINN